ncbi:septum formation initiator family protein [Lactococcus ileimucosae]|uniref:Septum formation initiator family protein n=1 Tax=Lactococcus ileimucosae TaxID=2941329 RepID=A0ABV4D6V3_9LACT|nr:septum formation initiator family protein [Lactococcus ileimucosae]
MDKKIIHLKNDYNKSKRIEEAPHALPKRKHLGIILIGAMLLFSLATISVVQSYQNLQKQIEMEAQAAQKNAALDHELALKSSDMNKLKDPSFLAKYARAKLDNSQANEKVFSIPEMVNGGIEP